MLPDDALEFMKKNAVIVASPFDTSGLHWAKLTLTQRNFFGGNVYTLTSAGGAGSGAFQIYWCHYKKDQVHTCALAKGARMMFTASMTNCTFGTGIPAVDGTVLVGHSNVQDGADQLINAITGYDPEKKYSKEAWDTINRERLEIVRSEQLKNLLTAFDDHGHARLERKLDSTNAQYSGAGMPITTFGILDGDKWRFYFQVRNGKNQVTGVHKIRK